MIQSVKFDSLNMNIKKLANTVLEFTINRLIEIYTDNLKKQKLLNFENKDQLFSIVKNHELYGLLEKNLLKNKYLQIYLF